RGGARPRVGAAPGGGGGPRREARAGLGPAHGADDVPGRAAGDEPQAHRPALQRRRRQPPGGALRPHRAGDLRPDQAHQTGPAGVRRTPPRPGGPRMSRPDDAERLLAYLAGELPDADALALEARLKAEPRLAEQYLALARDEAVLNEWARMTTGAAD